MFANNLGDVVAVCVTRVRIHRPIGDITGVQTDSAARKLIASIHYEPRQPVPTKTILKETQGVSSGSLRWSHILHHNVVRGVAGNKLVQKSWGNRRSEVDHQAGCG